MRLRELRIALVGPLPPPEGGMANQTRQLGELLQAEGARVTLVRVNTPYRPAWVGRLRGVRAVFRLSPYLIQLWLVAGRVDLFHIMANSGWSWHLFAAPALWIARMRGVPCIVNYRGGEAESFLEHSGALVRRTLGCASALAVPSGFLQHIFRQRGIESRIVPNIVDVSRFRPGDPPAKIPRVVVARSLEPIYDVATALRAFALVRREFSAAQLSIAGSGPQEEMLRTLAAELGIAAAVHFCGRLDRDRIAELYRSAAVVLNPSRVDNMPNSLLEAMASGVPVVSTDAGGIPFVVQDGVTGLLVPPGDEAAMASAVLRVLRDRALSNRLRDAALIDVQQYSWARIKAHWTELYARALSAHRMDSRPA